MKLPRAKIFLKKFIGLISLQQCQIDNIISKQKQSTSTQLSVAFREYKEHRLQLQNYC